MGVCFSGEGVRSVIYLAFCQYAFLYRLHMYLEEPPTSDAVNKWTGIDSDLEMVSWNSKHVIYFIDQFIHPYYGKNIPYVYVTKQRM